MKWKNIYTLYNNNKRKLLKLLSLSLPLPLHFSIKVMYFFCVFCFVEKLQGNYYTNNCYNIKYSYVYMSVCMLELKLKYLFFFVIFYVACLQEYISKSKSHVLCDPLLLTAGYHCFVVSTQQAKQVVLLTQTNKSSVNLIVQCKIGSSG